MPLQNRVTPFGDLVATATRGTLMGNRGGRIHDAARMLSRRRWASAAWICCRLAFKERHRAVWGAGYTELFFLDEPTALSAGHRPCFECRRADALAFAAAWARADGGRERARAPQMDRVLHLERLAAPERRPQPTDTRALPDGAFVAFRDAPEEAFAVRGERLLAWTPAGYAGTRAHEDARPCRVLTPPHIVAVLAAGYHPQWHPSADLAMRAAPSSGA